MKKVITWLMTIMLMVTMAVSTGCSPASKQVIASAGSVMYNGALVTSSSLKVYNNYDDINRIIVDHIADFTPEDQVIVRSISVKFAGFKTDFDRITAKAENIYKVTMNLDTYLEYYDEMTADYVTIKEIIVKNEEVFTETEMRLLKNFDRDIMLLHNQVQIVKATAMAQAEKANIDITGIVEKTVGLAKAFSTIAVLL